MSPWKSDHGEIGNRFIWNFCSGIYVLLIFVLLHDLFHIPDGDWSGCAQCEARTPKITHYQVAYWIRSYLDALSYHLPFAIRSGSYSALLISRFHCYFCMDYTKREDFFLGFSRSFNGTLGNNCVWKSIVV